MENEYREWDFEEWEKAWNIEVGKVYTCDVCKNTLLVCKGGTGTLDLQCCGRQMKEFRG